MKLEFSQRLFEKQSNIKFDENPSSGCRVVPADRQTDMTKLIVAFCNLANAPKNCVILVATTLSQFNICDFSGETFKGFELL
jgi:hypothetical protein